MDTLLHDLQPWMQKSLAESEYTIEKWVVQQTEQKIPAVNQFRDAFELRVVAQLDLP